MARPKKNEARARLNLDLPQSARERLETLRIETEADSLAEVIRRSLALYELLWQQQQQGVQIIARKDDEEKRVLLF
tara:strand:- start:503 stop:730 length:228 start_codon:yes stop_codon:yes gene_type:complete